MAENQTCSTPKIKDFTGTTDLAFRRLLSDVLSGCKKSREEIASELSIRVGRPITVSILNDYTATTKTAARFPAAYIADICEVTKNDELRLFGLDQRHRDLIAIGEAEVSLTQTIAAKRAVAARLIPPVSGDK